MKGRRRIQARQKILLTRLTKEQWPLCYDLALSYLVGDICLVLSFWLVDNIILFNNTYMHMKEQSVFNNSIAK